jgi:hypothetical protein
LGHYFLVRDLLNQDTSESVKQISNRDSIRKGDTMKPEFKKIEGAILPPLVLWMLGVPGVVVILLWLLVFRG